MALKDKITLTLDEVKLFLHIDHDAEDVVLQRMLAGAANAAEQYLNHDFGDKPIPEEVEMWIINRVARQYKRRGEGLAHESFEGETKIWDPEEYRDLWPYRRNPGV